MAKNKKYPKYTQEEKENILKEFLERDCSADQIVMKYNLNSRKILYDWKNKWDKEGTLKDNRGGNIKSYAEKVKTKDFQSMTKDELIDYIKIEEILKKEFAYLQDQKKNTKR